MEIYKIFGYAAIFSAIATLCTFVTGMLFFQKGGKWGPINDLASVAQMVFMLPLVWAVSMVSRPDLAALSVVVLVVGLVGVFVPTVTQTLLVARVLSYEKSSRIGTPAGMLIGVWLIAANVLNLGTVPAGMAIFGMIGGVGYIVLVAGFLIGQQKHPLFMGGSAIALVGYVVWAVWLGLTTLS